MLISMESAHKRCHKQDRNGQAKRAKYATNRYRNTSSVTSMLGDLEWDTLETRRKKIQLTMMYKIIINLIDIRAEEYLTKPTRQTRSSHSLKYISTDYRGVASLFCSASSQTWKRGGGLVGFVPQNFFG
jgi:hypothetical protein